MFPLFLRKLLMLWPHLSVVFRWLVLLGRIPACCRPANVTRIPKGLPSYSLANSTDIHNISIV